MFCWNMVEEIPRKEIIILGRLVNENSSKCFHYKLPIVIQIIYDDLACKINERIYDLYV